MLYLSLFLFFVVNVHSANILLIAPYPAWSHQESFIFLSDELVKRGHNVTFMTTNPPKENIRNLTTIDLSSAHKRMKDFSKEFGYSVQRESNPFSFSVKLPLLFQHLTDHIFSIPCVQDFIRIANKTSYDVVIIEDLTMSSFSGLVHIVGSPPVIGISTLPNYYPSSSMAGVPINPSFMPSMNICCADKMNFFERVYNTIFYWWFKYLIEKQTIPLQDEIIRKHFSNEAPSAWDFERNKSLLLNLMDLTLTYPASMPPHVIHVGPIHIKQSGSLPEDLQKWCDGAEDGVVYFSMGSQMKVTSLKEEVRDSFMQAFAKFPKTRFLFKWESEQGLSDLPKNVIKRKWFPQQDIFGHKNIRLFITHGGLQSLAEAIHYGVPILGIPVYGDQKHNTLRMEKEGAGVSLEMNKISPDSIYNALYKILYEEKESYKNNASRLSNIARDRMVPAMDEAIWWIDYVIKHKGTKHLRMASFDLSPYQLALIDVYAFLIAVVLTMVYALCFIGKHISLFVIVTSGNEKLRTIIGNLYGKNKNE